MKTLICALVLVMGCDGAIAESPTHGGGGSGGWERRVEVVGDTTDNRLPNEYPYPCRTLMEEAMRAMDPFVDWRVIFGLAHKWPRETTDQEKIAAIKKWDQAKAQCWSNY